MTHQSDITVQATLPSRVVDAFRTVRAMLGRTLKGDITASLEISHHLGQDCGLVDYPEDRGMRAAAREARKQAFEMSLLRRI